MVLESLNIKENFSQIDGDALRNIGLAVAKKGAIFVEIGSWKGYSTSFLGQVAKDCGGHLYCVDHWKGSPEIEEHKKVKDCLGIFRHNMEELGLSACVHPLVMESEVAGRIFVNNIADLVFIDADHHYTEIGKDLVIWRRKVKSGGILCGHDAELFYSKSSYKELIDSFLGSDYIEVKDVGTGKIEADIHPGVVKALYDCFDDKHTIIEGTRVWYIWIE